MNDWPAVHLVVLLHFLLDQKSFVSERTIGNPHIKDSQTSYETIAFEYAMRCFTCVIISNAGSHPSPAPPEVGLGRGGVRSSVSKL
eukprot:5649748-Amphidinium_carterae.1